MPARPDPSEKMAAGYAGRRRTRAGGQLPQARLVVVGEHRIKIVTEQHVMPILAVRYCWKARLAVAKRVLDGLERELS